MFWPAYVLIVVGLPLMYLGYKIFDKFQKASEDEKKRIHYQIPIAIVALTAGVGSFAIGALFAIMDLLSI
jgi:hypothetical protein